MLALSSLDRKLCHEFRFDVCRLFITRTLQEDRTNFMGFINKANNVGITWYWKAFACNHCCRRKEISVTYSESVFVALCIQHAKRVRRIIFSSVDPPGLQYISTLSYKRQYFSKHYWTKNVFNGCFTLHFDKFKAFLPANALFIKT